MAEWVCPQCAFEAADDPKDAHRCANAEGVTLGQRPNGTIVVSLTSVKDGKSSSLFIRMSPTMAREFGEQLLDTAAHPPPGAPKAREVGRG